MATTMFHDHTTPRDIHRLAWEGEAFSWKGRLPAGTRKNCDGCGDATGRPLDIFIGSSCVAYWCHDCVHLVLGSQKEAS